MVTTHCFNVEDAMKYGVECAVILYNIRFWCEKNKANGTHENDGYYWTYNSSRAFSLLFPYLTQEQVKGRLKKLEDSGAIITGEYNQAKYDRTKWYTTPEYAVNYQLDCVISPNGQCETTPSIVSDDPTYTRYNTDIKTDIREHSSSLFEEFYKEYPSVRKNGKTKPKALWLKLAEEVQAQIIEDVRRRKIEHRDWLEQQGKFIPAPEVYLRNEHWNRPIISSVEPTSNIYKIR